MLANKKHGAHRGRLQELSQIHRVDVDMTAHNFAIYLDPASALVPISTESPQSNTSSKYLPPCSVDLACLQLVDERTNERVVLSSRLRPRLGPIFP